MAYSKTFLLLGLAFAVVLLISSQVSARELAAESFEAQENAEIDRHHGHHGHHHGHHGHHGHHHGHHGHHGHHHGHHGGHHGGHPETEDEN